MPWIRSDEFRALFQRNWKGNLSRRWPEDNSRLTIFKRGEGFAWVINGAEGAEYMPDSPVCETEEDCLESLEARLERGEP